MTRLMMARCSGADPGLPPLLTAPLPRPPEAASDSSSAASTRRISSSASSFWMTEKWCGVLTSLYVAAHAITRLPHRQVQDTSHHPLPSTWLVMM